MFFDIETTGLSSVYNHIYLIGCAKRNGDHVILDQFFAAGKSEEAEILRAFLKQTEEITTLISFHGTGFDLPFIRNRCEKLQIPESLDELQNLDIFKETACMKKLLNLTNYKQKTIELFLGINREDPFTGGELIDVYFDYQKDPDPKTLQVLLLHNYEDVLGMTDLLSILSYREFLRGAYTLESCDLHTYRDYADFEKYELMIRLSLCVPVPQKLSLHKDGLYLMLSQDNAMLRVPIHTGELHYFYTDYKNYYYLPIEDQAIHRSVASYVDKEHRQPAKASNCYARHNGTFLPQFDELHTPVFREKYKDKVSYFELKEDFLNSAEEMEHYVKHLLRHIIG